MADRSEHNLEQRRAFDELVHVFDAPLEREVKDRLNRIVAQAAIEPGQVVLDVGTGVGVLIPLITEYNPSRILVCDLSPQMLRRTAEKYPGIEIHNSDIIDLDLPPACLDVAFLNGMFSNIYDKPAALAKLALLLKPGGRMVVSHPEGREFIRRLKAKVKFRLDLLPGREEWFSLLERFPFESIHFQDEPGFFLAVARRENGRHIGDPE